MSQIDRGSKVPFTNISTKNPGPYGTTKERTTVWNTTADTDEDGVHHFNSALDLSDYDIKINESKTGIRDTNLFNATSDKIGSNYDRKIILRDMGSHMSDRIRSSLLKAGAIRNDINLFGSIVLGEPMSSDSGSLASAIKDFTSADMYQQGDKNNVGNSDNKDGIGSNYSYADVQNNETGWIGGFPSLDEFISVYCDNQSGIKMGDAKVLNPDFQFNEMDDVRSDFRRPKLGRLYAERIYDYNLPTVILQPGIVDININAISTASTFSLVGTGSNTNLTHYLKDGTAAPLMGLKLGAQKIGSILNTGIAFGARTILDNVKWYKWTPRVQQYIKFVNEMLTELAVWMGLIRASDELTNAWKSELKTAEENRKKKDDDAVVKALTADSTTQNVDPNTGTAVYDGYLGTANDRDNQGLLGVIYILPQYKRYVSVSNMDKKFVKLSKTEGTLGNGDSWGWPVEMLCVPFGMSKGVNVSESFSNSTETHPIVNQYNEMYGESNQARLSRTVTSQGGKELVGQVKEKMEGVDFTDKDGNITMGSALAAAGKMFASYAGQRVFDGELGMVMSGSGRFILPEIWADSTFDRSYNISFKFRSPYGHRLSIYENTLVPLIFLIAMTAPRAVGISSYTSPFYVKAFSKGLFSCDMGMITSLSISRGEDKNDRTFEGFFRTVSVSMSIKDVLPTMQMGLDAGMWSLNKAANNGMINYMCNLAGVDFVERANLAKDTDRVVQNLRTSINSIGTNSRIWMAQSSLAGKIIGTTMRALGKGSSNPFSDRNYPKNFI